MYAVYTALYLIGLCLYVPRALWRMVRSGRYRRGLGERFGWVPDRLAEAGCLSDQERSLLSENYRFLRKLEHRLQIMFDLQTHDAPDDPAEVRKLALRMGYTDLPSQPALDAFEAGDVTPARFEAYRQRALGYGFAYVASGPLVRSSYKAAELWLESRLERGSLSV